MGSRRFSVRNEPDDEPLVRQVVACEVQDLGALLGTLVPLIVQTLADEQRGPTEIDVRINADGLRSPIHVQVETSGCSRDDAEPLSLRAAPLTRAQLGVLPYLATNLAYPEIAELLCVSRHTVKTHIISIYRKLGVSSRTEAVNEARRLGLIPRYAVLRPGPP